MRVSVYILTQGDGVHSHADSVESSVTLVAEHHLFLVVRLLTNGAGLALHTLPRVRLDEAHQLHTHVQTGWVA